MDGLRLLVYNGSSSIVLYHRTFNEMDGCVDDKLTNEDMDTNNVKSAPRQNFSCWN